MTEPTTPPPIIDAAAIDPPHAPRPPGLPEMTPDVAAVIERFNSERARRTTMPTFLTANGMGIDVRRIVSLALAVHPQPGQVFCNVLYDLGVQAQYTMTRDEFELLRMAWAIRRAAINGGK